MAFQKQLTSILKNEINYLLIRTFHSSKKSGAAAAAAAVTATRRVEGGQGTDYINNAQYKGLVQKAVPKNVVDLSAIHHVIGNLFGEMPTNKAEIEKFRLDEHQVSQYWKDGFLLNIPVLTSEQCDMLLDEFRQLTDPEHPHPGHGFFYEFHSNQSGNPNAVLLHALGHWRITPLFHDLIFLPAVTVAVSQLIKEGIESPVRFWHDQLFSKPPRHGGNVAWHQDYSYWTRTTPMSHLTVHIALEDQTIENGAVMYIPGSHKWTRNGQPLPITADDFGDMDSIFNILTEEEKKMFKPVCSNLKKGQASFHHPLSVHGSFGNTSNRPRRAAVLNYFADGVRSNTNLPLLDGVPPIGAGKKCEGVFFPLVFDPKALH